MERPGNGFATLQGQKIQNVLGQNQATEEHPQHYRKKQKMVLCQDLVQVKMRN